MIYFLPMSNEIKLFVGVFDTDDLPDLFQHDAKEGFRRVRSEQDANTALSGQKPPFSVVIHGGMADVCVAELTKLVIGYGATEVQIPLTRIRGHTFDIGDGDEAVHDYRRTMFRTGLGKLDPDLVSDKRIAII